MSLIDALPFLPNYVRAFGGHGPAAFLRINRPRSAGRMFSAMVKGQTYWLRNTLSDRSIFFQIIVQREYDTQQWSVLHQRIEDSYRRILGSGKIPIIIDAGANIGLSARWFATRYPHARVYAVEPDEANLLVLRRNSQGFPNINVVRGALWDCETKLHIANPNA